MITVKIETDEGVFAPYSNPFTISTKKVISLAGFQHMHTGLRFQLPDGGDLRVTSKKDGLTIVGHFFKKEELVLLGYVYDPIFAIEDDMGEVATGEIVEHKHIHMRFLQISNTGGRIIRGGPAIETVVDIPDPKSDVEVPAEGTE